MRLVAVVDDDERSCRLLSHLISKTTLAPSLEVEGFQSPEQLLDRMAQGYTPDILICDLCLSERPTSPRASTLWPSFPPASCAATRASL